MVICLPSIGSVGWSVLKQDADIHSIPHCEWFTYSMSNQNIERVKEV